jgi:hypothetical protein
MVSSERRRPPRLPLNEMQRANLRALVRHLFREQGTWIRVARVLGYRRSAVLAFMDGIEPGNRALARCIARALGLSLDEALIGKAPPRKAPVLVIVAPLKARKRKGGR